MFDFIKTNFFHNAIGLFVLIVVWLIFSAIGLRGVTYGKSIKEIRQETGMSLITMLVFVMAIIGLVTFLSTNSTTLSPQAS